MGVSTCIHVLVWVVLCVCVGVAVGAQWGDLSSTVGRVTAWCHSLVSQPCLGVEGLGVVPARGPKASAGVRSCRDVAGLPTARPCCLGRVLPSVWGAVRAGCGHRGCGAAAGGGDAGGRALGWGPGQHVTPHHHTKSLPLIITWHCAWMPPGKPQTAPGPHTLGGGRTTLCRLLTAASQLPPPSAQPSHHSTTEGVHPPCTPCTPHPAPGPIQKT